jgi:hypothetical protein
MSLVLAVLYESNWLREDGAKLFFFGACFIGVLALAKWASRASESSYEPPDPTAPSDHDAVVDSVPQRASPDPFEEVHPPIQIGNIEIRALFFSTFNAFSGPPDPTAFCDELTVEIEHLDTADRSIWHFIVGTPKGFENHMRERGWGAMYAPQVFVFSRYNLEAIRQEIVDRIQIGLSPTPDEASKAAGYES